MSSKMKPCFEIDKSFNGIRFFAELAEELLFYFSHDSFKVPTLNFHYLCFEALDAISKIELGLLEKGNLVPILQEFVYSYKNDPIVRAFYGEDINNLFAIKDAEGNYKKILKEIMQNPTSDSSVQRFKKCLLFLRDDLGRQSRYYNYGISQICTFISKSNLTFAELDVLQQYTKIILTELINIGYSQEYIYTSVKNIFFSDQAPVKDAKESFNEFISLFTLTDRKYIVYLPLKNYRLKNELTPFTGLDIAENVFEMFGNTCSYIIKFKSTAMDPEGAKIQAVELIDFCLSITQYCQHSKRGYEFKEAEVVDLESKTVCCLKTLASPISRQKRTPTDVTKIVHACFKLDSGIFSAIGLHASAFGTKDLKNQLLNLWTAMEVLIPIDKHGNISKINQISNSAATILCSNYITMLLIQLDKQISERISDDYEHLLKDVENEALSRAEKLLSILVLSEYEHIFSKLVSELEFTPLLAFRMQQYKNVLSTGVSLKSFYEQHSRRLTWQIMRIYRNRNMIVHDGSTLPFLEVILQNLHFYIDTIVDTFCTLSDDKFTSSHSIIMHLIKNENLYLSKLTESTAFSKDNYVSLILGK